VQILLVCMVGVRLALVAGEAQVRISAESTMAQTATTPAEGVKAISRQDLKDEIDRREPFVLLETLSPEHFLHVHLPGARNAPPDRVKESAPVLSPNKDTEVVTYCAGPKCTASADAARVLTSSLGYTRVRHYAGGKQNWTTAGLSVERGHEHAARA
jgi:rhodanese-related sulfurtransferase